MKKSFVFGLFCLIAVLLSTGEGASLAEKRKDTIRYGIESEILDLVTTLQGEKDDSLNSDLLEVLSESRSPKLREALLSFFSGMGWNGAASSAIQIVDGRDQEITSTVLAALGYLSTIRSKEALPGAKEILKNQETKYLSAAIRLMGRAGGDEEAGVILGIFESDEATDAVKQDAIFALGEIKAASAVEELIKLLGDDSSGKATRMYTADALGKIGDSRSIPSLVKAANGDDPQVRSSAVFALGSFAGNEAGTAVVQALRDSVPAVRIAAIKSSAAARLSDAEPYIRYRAQNDPEKKVREEALKALGVFGGGANIGFLQDMIRDKKVDTGSRAMAFSVLLDADSSGSRGDLGKVLAVESAEKDSTLYKALLRALSITSAKGASSLVDMYLLKNTDYTARIAGIDWVKRNKVSSLKLELAAMAESDKVDVVKKRAAAALADF